MSFLYIICQTEFYLTSTEQTERKLREDNMEDYYDSLICSFCGNNSRNLSVGYHLSQGTI